MIEKEMSMGRVTRVANYLTLEEIDEKIGQCNAAWGMKRWMAIRHALVDPKPAKEIGMHVGLAKQTVNNLVSAYNRYGPEALETPGKGGRRRSYLSLEEEKAFVESFKERSKKGEIATVKEIKASLEQRVGHSVTPSTVYKMIKRHDWRKVIPRPRHKKADAKEQEIFKKGGSDLRWTKH